MDTSKSLTLAFPQNFFHPVTSRRPFVGLRATLHRRCSRIKDMTKMWTGGLLASFCTRWCLVSRPFWTLQRDRSTRTSNISSLSSPQHSKYRPQIRFVTSSQSYWCAINQSASVLKVTPQRSFPTPSLVTWTCPRLREWKSNHHSKWQRRQLTTAEIWPWMTWVWV